jgi:hypothetical protein
VRTLFACLTAGAITFAFLRASGDAQWAALGVAALTYPFLNFAYQFWKNLHEPDAPYQVVALPPESQGGSTESSPLGGEESRIHQATFTPNRAPW